MQTLHAWSWYTCLILLLRYQAKGTEIEPRLPPPPKKEDCSTAGQEPQMSGESYYNLDEGEKMGFSSRHSLLWGELIRPNGLHWNQEGQRIQMALYKGMVVKPAIWHAL